MRACTYFGGILFCLLQSQTCFPRRKEAASKRPKIGESLVCTGQVAARKALSCSRVKERAVVDDAMHLFIKCELYKIRVYFELWNQS